MLACVILVIAVLLQPGKSDAAALFGGGASQTAFGPRGTQNFLGYVTIGAAIVFMGLGLLMSFPGVLGPRSVVRTVSDTSPAVPPVPAPGNLPIEVKTTPEKPGASTETKSPAASKPQSKKSDDKSKAAAPAKPTGGKP